MEGVLDSDYFLGAPPSFDAAGVLVVVVGAGVVVSSPGGGPPYAGTGGTIGTSSPESMGGAP